MSRETQTSEAEKLSATLELVRKNYIHDIGQAEKTISDLMHTCIVAADAIEHMLYLVSSQRGEHALEKLRQAIKRAQES